MIIRKIAALALLATLSMLPLTGCTPPEDGESGGDGGVNPSSQDENNDPAPSSAGTKSDRPKGHSRTKVKPPKAPLAMPQVYLSEQYRKSCVVDQGDLFPAMELLDMEGQKKNLADLYGDRLTVVCFWVASSPIATWQLEDLGPEVADVYGKQGVNVVAINYKDSADGVAAAAKKAGATFPILRDEDGSAFAQVANNYLPRTYLLDADGKILWFDADYSRDTQRDLDQAIRYALTASPDETAAN